MGRKPPLPASWLILPLCSSNWNESAASLGVEKRQQTVDISVDQSACLQHAPWGRRRLRSSGAPRRCLRSPRCPTASRRREEQPLCSGSSSGSSLTFPRMEMRYEDGALGSHGGWWWWREGKGRKGRKGGVVKGGGGEWVHQLITYVTLNIIMLIIQKQLQSKFLPTFHFKFASVSYFFRHFLRCKRYI